MKGILFFDTETTGKADFSSPPSAAHQPRIVQLAAMLTDESGRTLSHFSTLIRPDGWTIPAEAERIHGITTALCDAFGVSINHALNEFERLIDCAGSLVAHNSDFDVFMMSIERERKTRDFGWSGDVICTMKMATPVCRLPGRYGFKWPTLNETHRHFFGEDVAGAHDAMTDVVACAKCYFKMILPLTDPPAPADPSSPG